MTAIVAAILGIIGVASLLSLVVVVRHEMNCVRSKDWLSAMFGVGLMLGCLLIAFACFVGFRHLM